MDNNIYVKRNIIGLAPGSINSSGTEEPSIKLTSYGEKGCRETTILAGGTDVLDGLLALLTVADYDKHWVSVVGQMHGKTIERMQKIFNLNPLLCEDIVNTDQRPKFESYDECNAIFLRAMHRVASYQVAIVVINGIVISFSELAMFSPLEDRIRTSKGKIRRKGHEYLVYAIMDVIIDGYFVTLERLGRSIDGMEPHIIAATNDDMLPDLHDLKKSVMLVRRAVIPARDVTLVTMREMGDTDKEYFRDLQDHAQRVVESVDGYRDMLTGLQEMYMSSMGNRLNKIMKVLTLISAVFIPITFVTGFFGMNFVRLNPVYSDSNMYYATLATMVFKVKKWM